MSLNSNDAQILKKQGTEWVTKETLSEVRFAKLPSLVDVELTFDF